jgi:uncharacterized protein (TIGR00255 family)
MPVYSMTGYASVLRGLPDNPQNASPSATLAAPQIQLELRSVNGRFLDLSLRLPDELRQLEPGLRDAVAAKVRRGKVELKLALQGGGEAASAQLSNQALAQLGQWQAQVLAALPGSRPFSVQEALQACRGLQQAPRWGDEAVLAAAREAVDALLAARAREGDRLVTSLLERIEQLRELALRAEPLIPAVVAKQQQRFLERFNEALQQAGAPLSASVAQDRALAEAASYAIRIDVAEELTRLRAHLDEIEAQLKKGGELGKRLDFLIQELHREANTLGSKSSALELTGISVDMKVLIEQMREQVQNIE